MVERGVTRKCREEELPMVDSPNAVDNNRSYIVHIFELNAERMHEPDTN
jgi:hypothetical protein